MNPQWQYCNAAESHLDAATLLLTNYSNKLQGMLCIFSWKRTCRAENEYITVGAIVHSFCAKSRYAPLTDRHPTGLPVLVRSRMQPELRWVHWNGCRGRSWKPNAADFHGIYQNNLVFLTFGVHISAMYWLGVKLEVFLVSPGKTEWQENPFWMIGWPKRPTNFRYVYPALQGVGLGRSGAPSTVQCPLSGIPLTRGPTSSQSNL
jgi:hypothetical protein